MYLNSVSAWTQGKGNYPLPLQPIPKNNSNTKQAWSFTQKAGQISRWLPLPSVCHPYPLRRMGVVT